MSLSKDQVQDIARLARLYIGDEESGDVVDKLSGILEFVDQLQATQTDNVLPMAHPLNQPQRYRADVVTEGNDRDELQQNASEVRDGFYLVPKVIE